MGDERTKASDMVRDLERKAHDMECALYHISKVLPGTPTLPTWEEWSAFGDSPEDVVRDALADAWRMREAASADHARERTRADGLLAVVNQAREVLLELGYDDLAAIIAKRAEEADRG